MPFLFDTDVPTTAKIPSLLAMGGGTIIRYVARGETSYGKVIKRPEAYAIMATKGKIKLGLVYETNGRPNGTQMGTLEGQAALSWSKFIGAPKRAGIWGTVDYDAGESAVPGTKAWFKAFREALADYYRLGAYASGFMGDELKAAGLVDFNTWLTDSRGFAKTKIDLAAKNYTIDQLLPENFDGLDADPDVKVSPDVDIGDFIPELPLPTVIEAGDNAVTWLQVRLGICTGTSVGVDGIFGPGTVEALKAFQTSNRLSPTGKADAVTIAALNA